MNEKVTNFQSTLTESSYNLDISISNITKTLRIFLGQFPGILELINNFDNTIELLLAEDNGKWIGKGKSNIKEFSTTILSPKTYQNGLHSFSLELAMRDNTSTELEKLDGISDISFYLTTENED